MEPNKFIRILISTWNGRKAAVFSILVICTVFVFTNRTTSNKQIETANTVNDNGDSMQSFFPLSSSEYSNNYSVIASVSSTNNPNYFNHLPLIAMYWRKIGVDLILCLIGKEEIDYGLDAQKLVLKYLTQMNIHYVFIESRSLSAKTLSQMCRIFAATSSKLKIPNSTVILTTDTDYIPFHLPAHLPKDGQKMYLYNSDCCGKFRANGVLIPKFPMCTIAMRVSEWKEVLGSSNTEGWTNGSDIEKYLEEMMDNKDTRDIITEGTGITSWQSDQRMISYRIWQWRERNPNAEVVLAPGPDNGQRIDRASWPNARQFATMNVSDYWDAHLPRPLHEKWSQTRPFLKRIFSEEEMEVADEYVEGLLRLRGVERFSLCGFCSMCC